MGCGASTSKTVYVAEETSENKVNHIEEVKEEKPVVKATTTTETKKVAFELWFYVIPLTLL